MSLTVVLPGSSHTRVTGSPRVFGYILGNLPEVEHVTCCLLPFALCLARWPPVLTCLPAELGGCPSGGRSSCLIVVTTAVCHRPMQFVAH